MTETSPRDGLIELDPAKAELHPLAELFPTMEGQQATEFLEDIRAHGQLEPVWVDKDFRVLDGRHRVQACEELGRTVIARVYQGDDPASFVVSMNLHRRQLNESQRAMVAARLANMERGDNRFTKVDGSIDPSTSQADAAKQLNVSVPSVKRAAKVLDDGVQELADTVDAGHVAVSTAADIATLPEEEQREVVARGEKEILARAKEIRSEKAAVRRTARIEKAQDLARESLPLNDGLGQYSIIYADPPWQYEHMVSDSRVIENQYPTMPLDEICALPVQDLALQDCLLYLWTPSPILEQAFDVLRAWGFEYRTNIVWDKQSIGVGYYVRQQHEILLIARRGEPVLPEASVRISSVIRAPRGEHSAKPVKVYEALESMHPDLAKLELFARNKRDGWASWGNQAV